MRKQAGLLLVLAGAVLIISALSLFFFNQKESARAGEEAESSLQELQLLIQQQKENQEPTEETEETIPTEQTQPTQILDPEMKEVSINGENYIGYLSIPDLELELPVISQWNYERLQIAPCRESGSARTDDLVIAAHNFESHFGRLKDLEPGAEVFFFDMEERVYRYQLQRIEILQPEDVEPVRSSENDLVLYTCTTGGQTRVAAFCDRETD